MQKPTVVREVERIGDSVDNLENIVRTKASRLRPKQARNVGAVYVVHRDPELARVFPSVVDAHDVRMPQTRGKVSLAMEPLAVLVVRSKVSGQDLQRVLTGQARVTNEVYLPHSARSKRSFYRVARKLLPAIQSHVPDRTVIRQAVDGPSVA